MTEAEAALLLMISSAPDREAFLQSALDLMTRFSTLYEALIGTDVEHPATIA